MPYIQDKQDRGFLNDMVVMFLSHFKVDGHLNYFLFKMAKNSCHSYNDYKNFLGELNECSHEIRRRLMYPYEDEKKEENGDVK